MCKNNVKKSKSPTAKIATSFGVQVMEGAYQIPKNAIYIKTSNGYIYITDFKQFKTSTRYINANVLRGNSRSNGFIQEYIDRNSYNCRMIEAKIKESNWYEAVTIASISQKDIESIAPRIRQEGGNYNFKPTNRVNFNKTTDFDVKPQYLI